MGALDYYHQEIRLQQRIDQVKRTQPWESKVTVRHDAATGVLQVALPAEHATSGVSGEVDLYRPAGARADRTYPIRLDTTGRQAIPASELGAGRWKVRLRWNAGGEAFYAERDLVIPAPKR